MDSICFPSGVQDVSGIFLCNRSGDITACLEYPCFAGWRRVVGLVAGAICLDLFSAPRFAGFLAVLLSAFGISHGVVVLGC